MSVRLKDLEYLKDGLPKSKYQIRAEVLSWGRRYDQQTIDRTLQLLVKKNILRQKEFDNKLYYKLA